MFKWARERVRVLSLRGVERANAGASPSLNLAAVAQRVTIRVVAISSAGIDVIAGNKLLATSARAPIRKSLSLRRPGVHARWKEQNRVPFQSTL